MRSSDADTAAPLTRRWPRSLLRPDVFVLWVVLVVATLVSYRSLPHAYFMGSWGIFPNAARILFAPGAAGGFHLYHVRPDYQFGPVSTLVAAPLAHVRLHTSKLLASLLLTLAGLFLVSVIAGVTPEGAGPVRRGPLLTGGLLVMPVWVSLSMVSGHLDDVLAFGFGVFGVLQMRRGNPVCAACLLALAVYSKPWALGFAVALLALPRPSWLRGALTWAAVVAVAWVPFFLVEPRTVDALRFRLAISQGSLLRLLDPMGGPLPVWVRPAQLLLAAAVGVVVVRAGLVPAALLATVAARILLDPEIFAYYTAGAVLVAFLADRATSQRVPWFTLSAVVLLWLPAYFPHQTDWNDLAKWMRLLWATGTLLTLVVLARPGIRHRNPSDVSHEPAEEKAPSAPAV